MVRKATTGRKKKTVRAARRSTGMKSIPTTSWHAAKYFVHYEVESREWLAAIKDWLRNNLPRKDVTAVYKLPDWKIAGGSHWATVAKLKDTAPELIPQAMVDGFDRFIAKLIEEGHAAAAEKKAEEKTVKKGYTPSIQERISEQAQDACDAIEEWLEGFITDRKNFNPKGFDFTGHFANKKVSQAHARKIKKYYSGWYEEAQAIVNMPTPAQVKKIKDPKKADEAQQLRDGYSHLKKADARQWLDALETLMSACDLVIDAAKANRKTRVKKAPSKEKLIAKIKYKETDEKYKVASINPLEIIDSEEIWVFNTKTRKLGKYVADPDTKTMTVKGASLVGFDEAKSVQKTLRKPDEALKEFKKAGKIKLRKFMDEFNTTETKLNGRLNADTIILRAT